MKSNYTSTRTQQGTATSLIIGFIMMCSGFYLLLQSVVVTQSYFLGVGLYHFGSTSITSGMLMVPLIFGVGMIFYNSHNILGWALALGSISAIVIGVIVNTHFSLRPMSLFELLGILTLAIGGLGLFLRSCAERGKTMPE